MLYTDATDEEILKYIDEWASLLEKEDYEGTFYFTQHKKKSGWTPELIKLVIKSYADCEPFQKVTVSNNGLSIDGQGNIEKGIQSKEVTWLDEKGGYIWYDLNIDQYISDLTATFDFDKTDKEISIYLNEIHVM